MVISENRTKWINNSNNIEWIDGFPLGNGDIGAICYGNKEEIRFALNKSDVWDNRYKPPLQHKNLNFKKIRELVKKKAWSHLKEISAAYEEPYRYPYPAFKPCGQIEVKLKGDFLPSYYQILSVKNAFVEAEIRSKSGKININSFISAVQNTMVINVVSKHKLKGRISLFRQYDKSYDPPMYNTDARFSWLDFTFPDGLRYVVLIGINKKCKLTIDDNPYIFRRANIIVDDSRIYKELTIFLTIVTNKDAIDPLRQAKKNISKAMGSGYCSLFTEHKNWWNIFWEKSSLKISDKRIEKQWYFEIYKTASCSRQGKQAPGLYGLWCNKNEPLWHGDYHQNINVQMTYWPIYTSNHLELGEPFYRLFSGILPQVKKDTKKLFGFKGARYPLATYVEGKDMGGWLTTGLWSGTSAWICQHYWWHYLYSQDLKFLREIAYPIMKECINFYQNYLEKRKDGIYHIFPTTSPEQGHDMARAWGEDSTIDIALVKYLYKAIIKASEILKIDSKKRKIWNKTLKHLPEYPLRKGHLIELRNKEFMNSHHHASVLVPIYPVGEIGLDSPKTWLKIGKDSLENFFRKGYNGYCGFTFPWLACICARLGLGEKAKEMLHEHIDVFTNVNGVNVTYDFRDTGKGLPGHPSGQRKLLQIEGGGGFAAAVNEMCVQSYNGRIRIFPAISKNWDVEIKNFRAEGAFLVSSKVINGDIKWVKIKSLAGGKCHLINPWTGKELSFSTLKGSQYLLKEQSKL